MPQQTNDKRIHKASGRSVVDTERRTHVGQVIRKYRIAAGMDQAALAAQLGYTKTAVGNWELGLTRPDIDNVPRLCKILGIPVTELLVLDAVTSRMPLFPLQPDSAEALGMIVAVAEERRHEFPAQHSSAHAATNWT